MFTLQNKTAAPGLVSGAFRRVCASPGGRLGLVLVRFQQGAFSVHWKLNIDYTGVPGLNSALCGVMLLFIHAWRLWGFLCLVALAVLCLWITPGACYAVAAGACFLCLVARSPGFMGLLWGFMGLLWPFVLWLHVSWLVGVLCLVWAFSGFIRVSDLLRKVSSVQTAIFSGNNKRVLYAFCGACGAFYGLLMLSACMDTFKAFRGCMGLLAHL